MTDDAGEEVAATIQKATKSAKSQNTGKLARKWIKQVQASIERQRDWTLRSRKIIGKYRDEKPVSSQNRDNKTESDYPLLWSNTQTIGPAIYSRQPKPDVSRRYDQRDYVGLYASDALERIIGTQLDLCHFDRSMKKLAREDLLLPGRGVAWITYEPTYGQVSVPTNDDGVMIDDSGQPLLDNLDDIENDDDGNPVRSILTDQRVCVERVIWDDFGTGYGRSWDEVSFVWRRSYLSRPELIEEFGKMNPPIPLDWHERDDETSRRDDEKADEQKQAAIYEVWDKRSKKVYWVNLSYPDAILRVKDDPLGLEDFFPCPEPLLSTTGPDSIIPVPEYVYYQDQCSTINAITGRINLLIAALKVSGFYAGAEQDNLERIFADATGNILIPVQNWQALKDKGGVTGIIEWVPIGMVVEVLRESFQSRAELIQDVYQITGISDIMRGASDPNETLGAQQIKQNWGGLRVRDRQNEIARFCRDIMRLVGQVIAIKWTPDQLAQQSGIELPQPDPVQQMQQQPQMQQPGTPGPPQAGPPPNKVPPMPPVTWDAIKAMLANRNARDFHIDIEADSTIEADQQAEKQSRVEFLQAVSGFLSTAHQMLAAVPSAAEMVGELLMFGVRGFRAGRELENIIEKTFRQIAESLPPPANVPAKGPTGPSPDEIALQQQRLQFDQQKAAADMQIEQTKNQISAAKMVGEQQYKSAHLEFEERKLNSMPVGGAR